MHRWRTRIRLLHRPWCHAILGDGFVNPGNVYHDAAMDGVSCTLCHQIADDGTLGTPAGSSGHLTIEAFANAFDRPAYGKYANQGQSRCGRILASHPAGAHISDSALCATCHNLMTPVLDSAGQVIPDREFPEQVVYTEWQNSAFADGRAEATSCQQCHMARTDGSRSPTGHATCQAERLRRHGFYGGNT